MIVVDKREKNSLVVAELIEKGIKIEFKRLEVADYLIGNTAAERKTIADFISSMLSKRLLRQLAELKQYPKQLLIIEGIDDHPLYEFGRINPNAIKGMMLSTVLDFEIPIILTRDSEDTASFLILLEKKQKKIPKVVSLKAKRRALSLSEQQRFILEGFPGIGPSIAKELLLKFKTIKKVIAAPLSELQKVKKLGKKKAEAIKKIIETKYSEK